MKKIFNKIRDIITAVVLAIFLIILCCMFRKIEDKNFEETSMFCQIEDTSYWTVYYHKETKVMWIRNKGTFGGDFEILIDENGKPMIWE